MYRYLGKVSSTFQAVLAVKHILMFSGMVDLYFLDTIIIELALAKHFTAD